MKTQQKEIINMLKEMEFKEILIGKEYAYKYNNTYYKLAYLKCIKCFAIEYTKGKENALNNLYENEDLYSVFK